MASVGQILSILDLVLGSHRQQKHSEYMWFCPFCSHYKPKLAVNVGTGNWHCWVCGASGKKLTSLLWKANADKSLYKEMAELLNEYVPVTMDEGERILTLPREMTPLWEFTKDIERRHAIAYLMRRGITPEDILRYQIGYCRDGIYKGRLIFPSFDAAGKLNFFTARSYYEDEALKYKNPESKRDIVGFEYFIAWSYPIVLCEGPFDAIAIRRNAIPLFGKTVSKKLEEQIVVNKVSDLYIALDQDALRDSVYMAERFLSQGLNVRLIELGGKDPSEIGFAAFQEKMKITEILTFNSLVRKRLQLV